ncbi:glycine cleavage system protein H [Jeotgalibaca sp. MA1X17-3]|uniref:glycine cleavage system protein H n=1 Tax=Jeotgalibaca sp. MA1X17-3 TaxID=2908211 RepID=UPI001F1C5015|nr:glycine cleavage system protein H [Jeotgalibaca sp. MA1X17-3]UJF16580.1 glycine cleavage system protein H [Jeotgalibaca sp. MA1X17-3]
MTKKYSENGFWIKKEEDTYIVGLSEKGQDDLGEVIFIDLPEIGAISPDDVLIGVEAAKAVTELTSPLNGIITEIHDELDDEPGLLNSTSDDDTWIIKLNQVHEDQLAAFSDKSGL